MVLDETIKKTNQEHIIRKKVLVVDDEPVNISLIEEYLEREYQIIPALNGEDGLRKLESDKPDIVLLDIMMPRTSGYDVCKKIKEQDSSIPVIMVTALSMIEAKIKFLEIGADDYITKPINQLELITRMRSLLKKKESFDQMKRTQEKLKMQTEYLLQEKDDLKKRVQERTSELLKFKINSFKKNLNIEKEEKTIISEQKKK